MFEYIYGRIDSINSKYIVIDNNDIGYIVRVPNPYHFDKYLKSGEKIPSGSTKIVPKNPLPEEFNVLKDRLSSFLNTKVQFSCNPKGKGKISIPFNSEEDLERILTLFDQLK